MTLYQVKLPAFEGPFDLLCHLIDEQKVSIYDIPIATIAAQYLEYLQMMEILDIEVASSFLVMAATLLEIKSKMLLPIEKKEEDEADEQIDESIYEEDARSELVEKLLEYSKFKKVAQSLREMEREASRIYTRSNAIDRSPEEILEIQIGASELLNLFQALIFRRLNPPIHRVILEKIGVADKIKEIKAILSEYKGKAKFHEIVKDVKDRHCMVLSFMAILEMHTRGIINITQTDNFASITLSTSDITRGSVHSSRLKDLGIEPDTIKAGPPISLDTDTNQVLELQR